MDKNKKEALRFTETVFNEYEEQIEDLEKKCDAYWNYIKDLEKEITELRSQLKKEYSECF